MADAAFTLPTPQLLRLGSTLDGKYRIDRLIAEGGMGVVYEGYHLVLEHRIAVKVVRPEFANHPEAVARFLDEARAIARLRGSHIAHVFDTGRTEWDAPYMVLEYLDGSDLRAVLEHDGPLSIGRAVDYLLQICDAVAEAHAAGLVHRDLKPENLFVTREASGRDCLKVIDFGISKRLGGGRSLTRQGQHLGSPLYMAPEQMSEPDQVDERADIWSMGVVLYELLSNSVPFNGSNLATACMQVLNAEPVALRALRAEIPAELEQVVMRCLAKNKGLRFGSVAELRADLEPFAEETAPMSQLRRVTPVSARSVQAETPISLGDAKTLLSECEARPTTKAVAQPRLPLRWIGFAAAAGVTLAAGLGLRPHVVNALSAPPALQPLPEVVAPVANTPAAVDPTPPSRAVPSVVPVAVVPTAVEALPLAPRAQPVARRLVAVIAPPPQPIPTAQPTAVGDPSELVNPYPDHAAH
ncbi:MAG: serine/threonine-protein kinase [Polyangiaceae bacterium]